MGLGCRLVGLLDGGRQLPGQGRSRQPEEAQNVEWQVEVQGPGQAAGQAPAPQEGEQQRGCHPHSSGEGLPQALHPPPQVGGRSKAQHHRQAAENGRVAGVGSHEGNDHGCPLHGVHVRQRTGERDGEEDCPLHQERSCAAAPEAEAPDEQREDEGLPHELQRGPEPQQDADLTGAKAVAPLSLAGGEVQRVQRVEPDGCRADECVHEDAQHHRPAGEDLLHISGLLAFALFGCLCIQQLLLLRVLLRGLRGGRDGLLQEQSAAHERRGDNGDGDPQREEEGVLSQQACEGQGQEAGVLVQGVGKEAPRGWTQQRAERPLQRQEPHSEGDGVGGCDLRDVRLAQGRVPVEEAHREAGGYCPCEGRAEGEADQ
mmetsp:Transcript_133658/g.231841  ORF Transcript_133658/g.231841 Transcript_133658/m.231841 type:complete len:372 (-) Transcript_133658:849-1964(-)